MQSIMIANSEPFRPMAETAFSVSRPGGSAIGKRVSADVLTGALTGIEFALFVDKFDELYAQYVGKNLREVQPNPYVAERESLGPRRCQLANSPIN